MIPSATPTLATQPPLCTSQLQQPKFTCHNTAIPRFVRLAVLTLLASTALSSLTALAQPNAQTNQKRLPMVLLNISPPNQNQTIHIQAELANTPSSRQTGLMGRKQLAANQGMVFDFKTEAIQCMWMKNTLIPLDVGFFDAQGRLVNIATMQPETLDPHCSAAPIRYALEMPAGWFATQNLEAGAILLTPLRSTPPLPTPPLPLGANTPRVVE